MYKKYGEIFRFIIVGGINTINYYWVYLLLLKVLDINYLISHISGFIISFIISFYLNCYFVYHVQPTFKKFIQFPITQVVNMGLQTLLLYIFVQWLHLNETFAPFIGLVITIPITFVLSKWILVDK
ncbi:MULTISPECIES: GtrA family protein [Mammaliicoccus]|uniref:GtrA family protein n=1 Tax=Mammaliicoccus fleurettii TaxID=150056 RepID=A0ABS5MM61_9STAP|nr:MULTISPECIES: GtrA family protein [Mammaliicoccus]HCN60970.1 GtrA family protein [Staphylococcus sp.]MBL0847199.1 GtrA family protein [Mammaliicoccus fleurettii]MBO3061531.1 GtrA family protein [Mammaliicoccus fleurettii]MBS3672155.1 GtrA family protein [Mammaliicoccus fleurettii]MBS3696949.1 GtrA family protein [Mammaliicoccus fleurettii]